MNTNFFIALAPLLMLAGTAIAVMLAIAIRRNLLLAFLMAAAGIVVSLIALAAGWQPQAGLLLLLDSYARFYMAMLLFGGLVVLGLCFDYFKFREGQNEELPLLLITALLGASILVCSNHFASFFVGLEMLSISLFVLIGYPINQVRSLEAAIKYLILSGVSSAFLLMGMALIYAQCGELEFSLIGGYITSRQDINPMVFSGIVLIVSGLGFKLSLAPFHLWTPDVYQGAPAPITALIATVSKGAVFALLLRYFISSYSYDFSPLMTVFSFIAVLSILGGSLLALRQNNIKRLLGYSSIAHMGYLLVAFIAGGRVSVGLAIESVTFYLLAYFITMIGAFGVVSVLSMQAEAEDISYYRGLFWRRPWLAAVFTLMLLSLAGIPLTAGFIGKFYIFAAAADGRLWGLLITTITGSGLGIYYYLGIIAVMSSGTETEAMKPAQYPVSNVILAVLTMLLVWLGVYPDVLIYAIQFVVYAA
jgi:NADH-quinone oxidoreductase subunit N